ncbi:MAG TPA: sn-glycerol-3-phosphate ABC transporter substrate-binding protein UgpB [Burkholderiales bacterium]|nr:sn-glycerol-3-phosphate ABC transporter substrate-binding protein UgpB [Burkholderiales bacterium]
MKKATFAIIILCAAGLAHAVEEIRLWHSMSGALGAELDRLVAKYNASQKDYRVVSYFQGAYDEVMADEIEVRKGTRRQPHIVQVSEAATADIMRSGAARPLWQLLEESAPAADAKYLPAVSGYFSDTEGRLLALPFNASTPVLYYNRDAFRNARLNPDKAPQTWYEMPKALAALVESGHGCALTTAWQSWVLVENMSAWHNQRFATEHNGMSGSGARLAFNTRLMMRWISMLASWQKAGYFTYSGRGKEAESRFTSGECAMLTSSSASYAELRKNARFDLGVAQLPYYDDFEEAPQNTLVGGSALWALAGRPGSNYRGVGDFFAYLLRADVQADWHQRTGDVPLTRAAYELTRKQGFYRTHPGHEVAVRQLLLPPTEDSRGIRLGGLRRIRGIIDEELEAVWNGGKTPLDALNAAVRRGNLLLQDVR